MIPLRIKIDAATDLAPHVIRVPLDASEDKTTGIRLVNDSGVKFELSTIVGRLTISGLSFDECRGDVMLVLPRKGIAHRLIRAASEHNTLLITEQCDQRCVMCSQPPKEHHSDLFGIFRTAIQLAHENAVIGISGGEPTLYKTQLFDLLTSSIQRRPDLKFHVLTNGQHFDGEDIKPLREIIGEQVLWGVPLYSCNPRVHDDIVVKTGAYHRLQESFDVLARAGAAIELRTVILKQSVDDLPKLSSYVASQLPFISHWSLMQLERIGFARQNWATLFFDHSGHFDRIGEAIDVARAKGIAVQLFNFPLCTLPRRYQGLAVRSISDWKQKYLDVCSTCSRRSDCAGFFQWYDHKAGFKGISAL